MLLVVMCKMVALVGWCGKTLVVLCGCDVEVGQQTEWIYTNIYTNRKLRAGLVVMWKLVSKQNGDIQIYIQIANLEQD